MDDSINKRQWYGINPIGNMTKRIRLFSTVRVSLLDTNTYEVVEPLYDQAAEYKEDIARAMSSFKTPEYPTHNLMHYFSLPENKQMEDSIKSKIQSALPTVQAVQKKLYAALDLTMTSDLTSDEFIAFREQIETQYRDGWGAEFELSNIPTDRGDTVCLRLYHQDIEFYTAEEFNLMYGRIDETDYDKDIGPTFKS